MNTSNNSQLSFGKRLGALWSGATGKREEETLAYIEACDAADSPVPLGDGPYRRRPRVHVAMVGTAANEQAIAGLQAKREVKERDREEHQLKLKELLERLPSWKQFAGWLILVAVLIVGDLFFTFAAVADALGVDLSRGLANTSIWALLGVFGITTISALVTLWAGLVACGDGPVIKRGAGFMLLVACSAALAGIRAATVPDAPFAFGFFGFVIPLGAGLATGQAKRRVASFLEVWAPIRQQIESTRSTLAEVETEIERITQELENAFTKRRELAEELERLVHEPELHRLRTEARKAQARWWWDLGRWLVGKGGNDNDKE
ncbi:MAG: hypothetical protein HY897_25935 [Deltaproteobacteria bacterium]|nr:hypothetical protein [Deltaproteobacteria bacterium]